MQNLSSERNPPSDVIFNKLKAITAEVKVEVEVCFRFVAVAFKSEEEVSPVTYFCPAPDLPLDGSHHLAKKKTTLVRDLEYFIHTKFHQNLSSSSGEEVENVIV